MFEQAVQVRRKLKRTELAFAEIVLPCNFTVFFFFSIAIFIYLFFFSECKFTQGLSRFEKQIEKKEK